MTEIAKAYVQIIPTTKDFGSNLRSSMGGELESSGHAAGESWGSKFASVAKKVIAAAGIGKVITDSLNAGAELEQNLGGTEAVFGDFADEIQNKAKDAYKNMGLSASDYMATANKMGSLFQGSGLDQQRSLDLTAKAMQRAADVASVMGIDTTVAMESIAGAAKGNFTMMDNLGVAMNATTLEAYAMEKGMEGFKFSAASNAEKAELAMQMFFERTQQYADNFAHESESTFSGSMGAMKAAWQNMLAALTTGGDLQEAMSNLGERVHTFIFDNLVPMLGNLISSIPQLLGDLGGMLISELNTVSEHTDELLAFAVDVVTGLAEGFVENMPKMIDAAIKLATALGKSLVNFDWLGTAQGMIENLKTNFKTFAESHFGSDDSVITGIIKGIGSAEGKLWSKAGELVKGILRTLIDNLPQILAAGVRLVGELLTGILQAIPDVISGIWDFITDIIEAFTETDWGAVGSNIVSGIINGLNSLLPNLLDAAKNLARSAWETAKGWLGIESPSKRFAELGMYSAKGFAEGMSENESVISKAAAGIADIAASELNGSYSMGLEASAAPAARASGSVSDYRAGQISISIGNVEIRNDMDIEDVAMKLGRAIRREIRMGGQTAWA